MSEQPPRHLPYEEEAKLMSDVIEFFIHKLPHALESTAQHLDEAALAGQLVQQMEAMPDAQLAKLGIHRDDVPEVAAAAAGLFKVAHKAQNNR